MLEDKQVHRTQVSVLSHLHIQQQEQVEAQNKELRQLSALVEQQQGLLQLIMQSLAVEH